MMRLSGDELREIVARAATLTERLAWGHAQPADDLARTRWARWSTLLSGDAALTARLRAAGVAEGREWSALCRHAEAPSLPAWASTLQAVLARYDTAPLDPDAANPWSIVLGGFVAYAGDAVGDACARAALPDLEALLCTLAHRTLDLEARRHAAARDPRAAEQVSPADARRFALAMRDGGLLDLFREYSVLARLLTITTTHWIADAREHTTRYAHDRAAIAETFGGDAGELVDLQLGLSDAHQGGRRVAQLTFASGRILLGKPKSLGAERSWGALIEWLNRHGAPFGLQAPQVLDRDAYGWAAFVVSADCVDDDAVARYHQRLGALAAVAYVFGGSDLHIENVLPVGEMPVAVDLETFPHPHRRRWAAPSSDEPLEDSVLRTGVFPVWYPGVNGLSKMALARREGGRVPVELHLDAVLEGFEATYAFLRAHASRLLADDGPLGALTAQPIRYVHRATEVYAFLLRRLTYPKYLREGVDRSIELEVLARPSLPRILGGEDVPWPIFFAELHALEALDIPLFRSRSDSRALFVGETRIIDDAFSASGLDGIRSRLGRLSAADLSRQRRALEAAVHARTPLLLPPPTAIAAVEDNDGASAALRTAAHAIADAVMRCALDDTPLDDTPLDETPLQWIGLHRASDRDLMRIHLLGDNLYDGRAGVALLLAACGSAYHPLVRRTVAPLLDGSSRSWHIGAASGVGGQIYALVQIATSTDDGAYLDAARSLVTQLSDERLRDDTDLDVTDGVAGAALGLLSLYRATGDDRWLAQAHACGARLLATRVETPYGVRAWRTLGWPQPLTGMSHGAAGMAMTLLRLTAVGGDPRFREAAIEAIAYERAVFNATLDNWPDFRGVTSAQPAPSFQSTWCHGATGIGLARLATLDLLDTPDIRAEIDSALRATRASPTRDADHLCCGNMGRIELLLEAGVRLGRPELVREAQSLGAGVVRRAREQATYALYAAVPREHFSLSFFHGECGIGYSLLRLAAPARLPCVLQWA